MHLPSACGPNVSRSRLTRNRSYEKWICVATLVKMMFSFSVAIALKLVFSDVPGATPKKPASGLIA